MRKSKTFFMILFAVVFLAFCIAFTVAGTLASELYYVPIEVVIEPGGGKVVPPNWCLEHGYIPLWNPDNPYVCIHCD